MAYIGQAPANKPVSSSDLEDGLITNSKLAQDIISAETELAEAPADTDEFLISDAGVLKRLDASFIGGGGKILQVVSAVKSDTASWTGTQARTDTGLTASITPSATSSKILILWLINIGYGSSSNQFNIHLDRGGTEIGQGDASSSRKSSHYQPLNYQGTNEEYMTTSCSASFLDSPSTTSSTAYKVQHSTVSNGETFYINRSHVDRQYTGYDSRNMSSLILMEIGA